PIVMVTSAQPVDVARSFRAVEAGALTLLEKPGAPGSPRFAELADELVTTVKLMADVKLVRRRRRRASVPRSHVRLPERRTDLVAIGSSTGGPAALASLLKELPPDLPVPVLIVQHIARGFDRGLAEWLDKVTPLSVRLAEAGRPLSPGEVLVGPHDRHLGVLGNGTAELSAAPAIGGHRPSATHLFSSVARSYGARAMGVILTGMGNDGAVGLLDLRSAGGVTVAQDKASSVVYGMPREAVHLGAVDCILPLQEIAPAIARACRRP
ncbi:MAG: chemotaxis protein CheB, partial [Actinomycetota bacterium]